MFPSRRALVTLLLACTLVAAASGAARNSNQAAEASAPPIAVSTTIPLSTESADSIAAAPAPTGDLRDRFPDWIEDGIRRYGPITVFAAFAASMIGIHVNEDMVLIPAGFLAAGDPDHPVRLFWQFALFAYLGIVLGDAGWFWLCRTFGTRFLHSRWFKRLLHPRRLLEVKHQIDVRGALVLLAARFIPGTRIPVITMCGMMHMAWWKFLVVELSCVMVTVTMQLSIGWLASRAASSAGVTKLSHQIAIGVGVTALVVLATYLLSIWLRSRQARRRAPRARVRWLRFYNRRVECCPH